MSVLKWLSAVILIWCSLVSVYKLFILYVCCLIVVVLHLLFRNFTDYWHYTSHKYKSLKRWCEIHIICDFRVTDVSFKWDSRKNLIQDKISLTSKVHFKKIYIQRTWDDIYSNVPIHSFHCNFQLKWTLVLVIHFQTNYYYRKQMII